MTAPQSRFESLNALRGVAALFIACVHFPALFFGFNFGPMRHAYVITNLFFALSGFITMYVYGERLKTWGDYATYAKKRIFRLVPLHLVTTGTILLSSYVAFFSNAGLTQLFTGQSAGGMPAFPIDTYQLTVHLLMLQGFNLVPHLVLNFPAWSMGALFFCSLIFGFMTVAMKGLRLVLFSAMALAAFLFLAFKAPNFLGSSADYGFVRAVACFFSGALTLVLWRALSHHKVLHRWAVFYQSLAVVLLLGYTTWTQVDSATSLWSPLVLTFFLWAFAFDHGDYARFLRRPVFDWLAKRSYSIFMNQAGLLFIGHQAVQWSGHFKLDAWSDTVVATFALLAYLALTLVLSDWTYKHIELRFDYRGKKKAAAQASVA